MDLETLKSYLLISRKKKETVKSNLLRTLIGEIETQQSKGKVDIQGITSKMLKDLKISLESNPEDIVLLEEKEILESLLPRQMSQEELTEVIQQISKSYETKEIGEIMRVLKANFNGGYDGKMATEIIKSL